MGEDDTLAESPNFEVRSSFETVHLRRSDGTDTVIGHFWGDPECGLIDRDEKWCVVGGCGLIVYWLRNPYREFEYHTSTDQWSEFGRQPDDIWWVGELEQTGEEDVRLVVGDDPNATRYDLNVRSMRIKEVCEVLPQIRVRRVYHDASQRDGLRVLVDRIWPRGMTKNRAQVDLWMKAVAPSTELGKWFDHDAEKWQAFKERYFAELDAGSPDLDQLLQQARDGVVTLLFSARDQEHNQAVALSEYLEGALSD